MAQSVKLWGATYNNVPAIEVPKSTTGYATFTDVTPTTAVASDVVSGKVYFKSDGTQDTGTATYRHYYTGDSAPSSSLGVDGDVYLDTTGGGTTINNQDKTVTPDETGLTVTADSGYTGLGTVTVNAISSSYVGSGITRRYSTDLESSGATVTVPAGYYSSQATKSITTGTATAPTSITGTSATVSTGTNTITLSKSVSNTPRITTAGYISSGTAGDSSVSLTASVTTKARATITPGTSNQTISSGTYLTGTQTISGDANLVAGNIKKDTTIFGVTGSYESTPSLVTKTITPSATTQVVTPDVSTETLLINSGTFNTVLGYNGDTLSNLVTNMSIIGTFSVPIKLRVKLTVEKVGGNTYSVDDEVTLSYQTTYYTVKTFTSSDIGSVKVRWYNSAFQIGVSINTTGNYRIIANTVENPNVFEIYKVETTEYDGLSQVTVNGDADLIASNIKSGVDIFGVLGTYGGGGGGGLEYEEGTWSPSEDIATGSISFTNAHTTKPFFVGLYLVSQSQDTTTWTAHRWTYYSWYALTGYGDYTSSSAQVYGEIRYSYRGSSTTTLSVGGSPFTTAPSSDPNVTSSGFSAYCNDSTIYWRSSKTYKWVAVWWPTT